MPTSSAAMSMSRIAIQDRPMRERARLRAIQASAMTKASTNRYFASLPARGARDLEAEDGARRRRRHA